MAGLIGRLLYIFHLFLNLMREEGNNQRKGFNNRRGNQHNRGPNKADRNNDQEDKKKFIQRDNQGGKRGKDRRGFKNKQGKKEERDLDRELRDYWISKKGGEKGEGSNTYVLRRCGRPRKGEIELGARLILEKQTIITQTCRMIISSITINIQHSPYHSIDTTTQLLKKSMGIV